MGLLVRRVRFCVSSGTNFGLTKKPRMSMASSIRVPALLFFPIGSAVSVLSTMYLCYITWYAQRPKDSTLYFPAISELGVAMPQQKGERDKTNHVCVCVCVCARAPYVWSRDKEQRKRPSLSSPPAARPLSSSHCTAS